MKASRLLLATLLSLLLIFGLSAVAFAGTEYDTLVIDTKGSVKALKDETTSITAFTPDYKHMYYIKNNTLFLKDVGASGEGTEVLKGTAIYYGYASGGYIFLADEANVEKDGVYTYVSKVYAVKIGDATAELIVTHDQTSTRSLDGKYIYLTTIDPEKNVKILRYGPDKVETLFAEYKAEVPEGSMLYSVTVKDGYIMQSIGGGTEYKTEMYKVEGSKLVLLKNSGAWPYYIIGGYAYYTDYKENVSILKKVQLSNGKVTTLSKLNLSHFGIVGKYIYYLKHSGENMIGADNVLYRMDLNGKGSKKLRTIKGVENGMVMLESSNGVLLIKYSLPQM